jgi:toxin ParE1/3/4
MVNWSDHALIQLRHIHAYIAQTSPIYAKKVSGTLVEKTLALNDLPYLGRIVPELGEESIRELSVYSYRLIYEIKNTHIDILAIIHKRRDLKASEIPRE